MSNALSNSNTAPVLVLGAGVNGLCLARELAINRVPVVVVDLADLGGGASAKSSRLIHGGLRYLEYGEFRLVKESLEERARLLRLAPNFVRPLQLHIPARRRRGGLLHAGLRFCGLSRVGWLQRCLEACGARSERGRWAAQVGLTLYDWISRHGGLPKHSVTSVDDPNSPPFDRGDYRWVCSYWDAQMLHPERFCVALWRDASRSAAEQGQRCELLTYHRATLTETGVAIHALDAPNAPVTEFRPALIVNATGAWGDWTLEALPVKAPRLFGGTRGSHILTRQPPLRDAIGDAGIYAEARDGRLVFILPWGQEVLVGTTDIRFDAAPQTAVATPDEVQYLVQLVNEIFPQVQLTADDVSSHYSGVRPLPYVPVGQTAAVSRDHAIDVRTTRNGLRIETLVGGKLTTCRAFGEEVADRVLRTLGRSRIADTRERPVPGGENYPSADTTLADTQSALATQFQLLRETVQAVWNLLGTETEHVLRTCLTEAGHPGRIELLPGTSLPLAVVDWIIRHESVRTVADLVERRLLLVFTGRVNRQTLAVLEQRVTHVRGRCLRGADDAAERLDQQYGVRVE